MIRRNLVSRFRYLLWSSDMEVTRFTLGIAAILWAIFLAWPGELFPTVDEVAAGRGRMTYAIMARIMSEDAWAVAWFAQGAVLLWSLFTGVRTCTLMVLDGMLGVMLWSICVLSSFIVYWPHMDFWSSVMAYKPPAAMAGELSMVAASWWVLIRYKCGVGNDRTGC